MELGFAAGLPEAWRLLRIGLKPRMKATAAGVSTALCLLVLVFLGVGHFLNPQNFPARELFQYLTWAYFIYHLILLWALAPGAVAVSMMNEWKFDTWLFQKTTPQSAIRLALGKVLGAPAAYYVAFIASVPYLLLSAFPAGVGIFNLIVAYAIAIAVSLALSALSLYSSAMMEKQKAQGQGTSAMVGAPAIIIVVALMFSAPYFNAVMMGVPGGTFSSLFNLTPFTAIAYMFSGRSLAVPFMWMDVPAWAFSLVFYGVWTAWLLIASAGQLDRKMSIVASRLPLVVVFLWCFLLVAGLGAGGGMRFMGPGGQGFFVIGAYLAVSVFIGYLVIAIHTRRLIEVRPWLYHYNERPGGWRYFFRTDAPNIFIVALLLAMTWVGWAILILMFPDALESSPMYFRGGEMAMAIPLGMATLLLIRDALFIQYFRLGHGKEKLWLMAGVYLIVFIAIPSFINLVVGVWVLDLSPLAIVPDSPVYGNPFSLVLSPFINVLIIAILALLLRSRIRAALGNLPPEIALPKTQASKD